MTNGVNQGIDLLAGDPSTTTGPTIPPPPPPPLPGQPTQAAGVALVPAARQPGDGAGSGQSQGPVVEVAPAKVRRRRWRRAQEPAPEPVVEAEPVPAGSTIEQLEQQLIDVASGHPVRCVFVGAKGGVGTTTLLAYTCEMLSEVLRVGPIAIDGNMLGTLGQLMGKSHGQTHTLRSLFDGKPNIPNQMAFDVGLTPTRKGTKVVAADWSGTPNTWLTAQDFEVLVDWVAEHCLRIMIDTGSMAYEPAALKAVEMADRLVLVVNCNSWASIALYKDIVATYEANGMADKVRKAVVVMTDIRTGEMLADWREFVSTDHAAMVQMPYDAFLAAGRQVSLDQIRQPEHEETYRAFLTLGIAIFSLH